MFAFAAPFVGVFTRFASSRVGQIIIAVVGAIIFLKIRERKAFKAGERKAVHRIEKVSNEAAMARQKVRNEIDVSIPVAGAAERLRERFARS